MASTVKTKRARARPAASRDEHLKELVKQAVREVLEELRDPDAELEVRPEVLAGLRQQHTRVAAGDRGRPLSEIIRKLRLE